jgi:hypothetical protein
VSRKFCLILFLSAIPFGGFSQTRDDFRYWQTLSVQGNLSRKLEYSVDAEARLEDNARKAGRLFLEPGLRYKFKGETRIQISYRWMRDFDQRWWGNRHRVSFDFIQGLEKSRWNHQIRFRFQAEKNGYGFLDHRFNLPEVFARQMIKSSFLLSRIWKPYFSAESRFLILEPRNRRDAGFDRFRIRIGTDYKISKYLEAGLYYCMQQETGYPVNDRIFILGTELTWKIR